MSAGRTAPARCDDEAATKTEHMPEAANKWMYTCALKLGLELLAKLDIRNAWATACTGRLGLAHWVAKHESALQRASHGLHEKLFPEDQDDRPMQLPLVPAKN